MAAECLLGTAWADVAAGVADRAMIEVDGTADKAVDADDEVLGGRDPRSDQPN